MLPEYFAIIGAVIGSLGGYYYLYETFVGKAQPNRITWLMWGVLPMIIFAAQKAQGIEELAWTSFIAGFTPFVVVAASFINKKANWRSKPRDFYLMAAAILGIILWALTDNPNYALLLALVAHILASIPTFIKAYQHPQTESWIAYTISTVGFGISFFSVQTFDLENAAFVAYLLFLNITLAILSSRGRK